MVNEAKIPRLLALLVKASEATGGRFQQYSIIDGVKDLGEGDQWLAYEDRLKERGLIAEHTTIWYVVTDAGRAIARA